MKATHSIIIDGQLITAGETIPDLGSFICTEVNGNIRKYEGLSFDVGKLPHYNNLGTGSSALCLDTGELYKYEKTSDIWYKL